MYSYFIFCEVLELWALSGSSIEILEFSFVNIFYKSLTNQKNMILQVITLFLRGKFEKKPIKFKDFRS